MQKNDESNKFEKIGRYNNVKNSYRQTTNPKYGNEIPSSKYTKDNASFEKTSVKANKISGPLTSFIALVSTVLIGFGGVGSLLNYTEAKAKIESYFCEETTVYCYIEIEKFEEGMTIELYNDFTSRSEKIEQVEHNEFFFEGLQPYMNYTLAIKKASVILDSKNVYTKFEREKFPDSNYNQEDKEPYPEENQDNTGSQDNENIEDQDPYEEEDSDDQAPMPSDEEQNTNQP